MKFLCTIIAASIGCAALAQSNIHTSKYYLHAINSEEVEPFKITLAFDAEQATIVGKSGCNNFSIGYEPTKSYKKLKTKDGLLTMKLCDEKTMNLEQKILQSMQNKTLKLKTTETDITAKSKNNTLHFKQINNTEEWNYIAAHKWKLVMINDTILYESTITLKYNIEAKTVAGFAGCNNFFGSYKSTGNTIEFSKLASTKMACIDNDTQRLEIELLQTLNYEDLTFDISEQSFNIYKDEELIMIWTKDESKE